MEIFRERLLSKLCVPPSSQPPPLKGEGARGVASNELCRSGGFLTGAALTCPAIILISIISLILVGGCQTTTVSTSPKPVVKTGVQQPAFSGDILDSLDPCGNRMQDLCGLLTQYYNMYHRGPAKAEDLQPFAIPGQQIQSSCPVSGKPYVFVPDGLEATGQNVRIYVYDPEPVHNGARWCAIKQGGAALNQPVIMFADKLPEATFQRFRPATPLVP